MVINATNITSVITTTPIASRCCFICCHHERSFVVIVSPLAKPKLCGKNLLPCFGCSCLLSHMHALTEAIRLSHKLKNVPFVSQPIQQGNGHFFVSKNGVPIPKAKICRHDDRHPFIQVRAELKQQLRSLFGKWNET